MTRLFLRIAAWAAHAIVAALLLGSVARAQLPPAGENAISARLLAESPTVAPGGKVTLAIAMQPRPGWHGYWQNPGDSGGETKVDWTLPAGVTAGPLQYPVPHRLLFSGMMNYVYESGYALLVDIAVPQGIAAGSSLPVRAKVDYIACTSEVCVPEKAELALTLRAGAPSTANAATFDGFRKALPKPLGSQARFELAGDRFRLAVPLPAGVAAKSPYFYPLSYGAFEHNAVQTVTRTGDTLIVDVESAGSAPTEVAGVLDLGTGTGLSLTAVPGPVAAAGAAPGATSETGLTAILAALFGAILGGLLLNLMPCVFPILSLKALSLAKAGGEEGAARRDALAYTAGAVLTCLALGAGLLALRATGVAAGWAFQLQDPRVIFILLLLVTAIALNLAGLFELPAVTGGDRLAGQRGARGSFWTGALAAFVATPCTGPFMGVALGAALILPVAAALAIFAGLGLGLALPFLLLGFVPALRRQLPRPGPWMARFRRLLSIPMFVTALALAWVLGRQSGADGMALGLAAALALALALWIAGRRQQGGGRAWLGLVPAAAAAVAALVFLPAAGSTVTPASKSAESNLKTEPFSEARLAELQQGGRKVFVYFTADWCLTCKVNEKVALERSDVAKAFGTGEVAVLVGDWTTGDAAIGRFLEAHGRSGVPLYLFYAPGRPVVTLPQVLTPARLISLVS
ncbi:thioredoxin family protein [Sphingomonas sabuli]|uniref:Thioredoxin family protein n=1 Tax=Sphingomonas sabuli TaxID=2764186 RepID=A0A7G9L1X7_9SPHN|nr:protein-disulfide reductase DsbD domain-containing protein [Sphingomonas sabuli]QNM82626.1 thioredoxin family protein [Sphingomonas sabuli]